MNFSMTRLTEEAYRGQMQVAKTDDPGDLARIVVDKSHHWVARDDAANKLLEMWKESQQGVTLNHLVCVRDHTSEPYKSQARTIIGNRR